MGPSCRQSMPVWSGNMISPKSSLPAYFVVADCSARPASSHLVCVPPGLGGMFIEQLRSRTIIRSEWQSSAWAKGARSSIATRTRMRPCYHSGDGDVVAVLHVDGAVQIEVARLEEIGE